MDAPVVDPFRQPPTPYAAGNRGIEFATRPGTAVRAAGPGSITFAGRVAGHLHVTVDHGSGLLTTYSHLAGIRVVRGRSVRAGTVLGVAAARLHVGARRDGAYIDPASLWARSGWVVHLVALRPW